MDTPVKTSVADPDVPNWVDMELPAAWPDNLHLASIQGVREFWSEVFANKKKPVKLPDEVDTVFNIPKYALQEFHNLPNGVYSQRFSRGYITGFDISMLGQLAQVRDWIATELGEGDSFLDLGCAGGKLAQAIMAKGATDVWGIDPSPYLLKHAQTDNSGISFIQGVAEDLPFSNERFDGVGACFLFHEVPPRYIQLALKEIARVLRPAGKLVIAEPSPVQLYSRYKQMFRCYGWQGLYFKKLAHFVYEPFLDAWHKFDIKSAALEAGLTVLSDEHGMPVRKIVLQKAP